MHKTILVMENDKIPIASITRIGGLILIGMLCSLYSFSQKITLIEGNLHDLAGQTVMNVQYKWDNCAVGKYSTESAYLDYKTEEYNKKTPERGDKWRSGWNNAKTAFYQPKFEELFNKIVYNKMGLYLSNKNPAKYTMIVNTTYMEPGWNVVVAQAYANINIRVKIVETQDTQNVVAIIDSQKNPGRTAGGNDYDYATRLSEAYALAGKKLGAFVVKNVGK